MHQPPQRRAAEPARSPAATPSTPSAPGPGREASGGNALLSMQRGAGNRHVQRLIQQVRSGAAATGPQRRLRVGSADDPLERQAEQVARAVTGAAPVQTGHAAAPAADTVGAAGGVLDQAASGAISAARGGGRPIPAGVRAPLEDAFGADFGAVRVHTGARAAEANDRLRADGFTVGQDVFLGRDLDLGGAEGRHLLAHELTHVVQQDATGTVRRKTRTGRPLTAPSPATDAALRSLQNLWAADPWQSRTLLKKRVPNGPPMIGAELAHLETLSDEAATDPQAAWWLHESGLGTLPSALVYIRGADFTDWLKIPGSRRLYYASLAWDRQIGANSPNPPPSFTLGRHMAIKSKNLPPDALADAKQERDATIRNAFVNTLRPAAPGPGGAGTNAEAAQAARSREILEKIFLIMQRGLAVFSEDGPGAHLPTAEDVARSLAHGGRVNVRIPALRPGQSAFELTSWLGITDATGERDPAVTARAFGTHYMEIGKNKKAKRGRRAKRGKFVEHGGKPAALSNTTHSGRFLYGLNVAAGGYGNADFNNQPIRADGAHGHMFLGFTPPTTKRDGALQIGMETTEPHAPSLVGYKHNWNSTEATANPESSFYGHKSGKIGTGKLSQNQRFVDLKNLEMGRGNWHTELLRFENQWTAALAASVAATGDDRTAYESLVGPQSRRGW